MKNADLEHFFQDNITEATRLAYLIVGRDGDVDDVVQDALLRVAARARTLGSPTSAKAYLRTTISRLAIDRARSAQRRERREDRAARQSALVGNAEVATVVAARVDLLRALETLSPEQRATVVLRFWLDYSEAEIARTLRCRPGTVKSRLARALRTLEEVLDAPH